LLFCDLFLLIGFQVPYQDFYYKKRNTDKIFDLFKFLGLNPCFENDQENIFLEETSTDRKANNKETYQLIKNVEEINEKLGKEYGYLF